MHTPHILQYRPTVRDSQLQRKHTVPEKDSRLSVNPLAIQFIHQLFVTSVNSSLSALLQPTPVGAATKSRDQFLEKLIWGIDRKRQGLRGGRRGNRERERVCVEVEPVEQVQSKKMSRGLKWRDHL